MDNNIVKVGAKVGAGIGVAIWVLFGIMAGFYFGGYGAITILSKLYGGPVEATLVARIIIVCGMLVGIFSMGTVCLVVGGLIGSLLGWVVSPVKNLEKQKI